MRKNTAGERGRRAEGERRTLGVPGIGIEHGTPCPTAFGVNLRGSSPAGFTLVELLVTVIIIMILTGLILGVAKYASTKAATSRTQAEIAAMEMALEHYKSDNGVYPPITGLRVTAGAHGYPGAAEYSNSAVLYAALALGPKRYFDFKAYQLRPVVLNGITTTNVIDPFGNPYNYYQTNDPTLVTNVAAFDLWSYGPNGRNDEGTNDDITNWRR
ncbi:MAG: type II secretion system protein GspG [Verrucomicrobiia bacterium]